jgi:hypothetical protein
MKNRLPDDDLVAFLKQYRPASPPARSNIEEQLMELVTREPLPPARHSHQFFWIISSAMAGSLLLSIGGYRWLNPSSQVAAKPEELESFMVDGWNSTVGDPLEVLSTQTTDAQWLTLAETQSNAFVSSPDRVEIRR